MELAAVVALWTETLDPATSLAACNLAAKLPPQPWPEDAAARQAAWRRQARRPAGREPELMRAFDFAKFKAAHVLERLEAMSRWEPHPVVTRWLVDVFARQTRAPMLDGQKCFRRVFHLLEAHLDLDGAARLRDWRGTHQARIHASRYGAEFFDAGMTRVLAKAGARLANVRPLADAERAALERADLLAVPPPPPREPTIDALLDAVYEAPWDDAPRAVLGDLLQQRGDPRGEFIALDLLPSPTAEQRRRRNALLRQHGKGWFPAALHRIVNRDARYERGFLASGQLVADRTPRELSTFRELAVGGSIVPDFDHPEFRAIEAWRGVSLFGAGDPRGARLASCGPQPRVTRMGLSASFRDEASAIVAALRPEAWPSLTEVGIECHRLDWWDRPNMPAWFDDLAAGLGARLPRLHRLELAGIATYLRDGAALRLTGIALPFEILKDLAWTSEALLRLAARERWFHWLAAHEAPIQVTHHAAELRARLPPEAAARVCEISEFR
jgi:uncharacterized protein (TIGR02996 family)